MHSEKMKSMKKIILLSILFLAVMVSCKPDKEVHREYILQPKSYEGEFTHAVYFWLKEPADEVKNQAFEKSLEKFVSGSNNIKTYHLGKPASTDRSIIDRSYSYALIVTFDSKASHDAYQDDPAHKLFIKESEHLWETVKIYDSVNVLK